MDNLIGKMLGQYQILELAGKGGMAAVYKAHQPSLNRYVALKVLPAYLAQDEQFVVRFRQEALAAAALRHPNIMVIYDVGQDQNLHYIAAEYLEGSTLAQVLEQQRGPLPLPRTVSIINQLASALDFAHQRGLVHRDVKPSNAFVGPGDHVTLMDFGIVKALTGGMQMTRTGSAIGTPEYMSPEQAEGRPVDQRSDIYSLGVVLYQVLTGRVPFEAKSPTQILLAHVTQPPTPPTQINPAIPRAVEAVVLRALAKRPEERWTTAGEMAQALARAASGPSAPAYVAPTVVPGRSSPMPPPPSYTPQPSTPPPPPPLAASQPYTPPPPPAAPKSGRAVNWLLWGGLGAAALAFACIVGFVICNATGSPGGKETATPTALPLARATPTATAPALVRATPTATRGRPTPTSSVGILFSDDFASMSQSESNGWVFESGDNVDWSWSANALSAYVHKKNWIGWNTPDGEYDDFGAEIEAQPSSSGYIEYGIIFRISGETDTRSYYIFGVTSEGDYFLQKKVDGKWADDDPVSTTSSPVIKKGQAKNRLGVRAEGAQISLYINGTRVETVDDDSTGSGTLGVYAGTGDSDEARVTYSRLTILSAERAAADWGD
jgi:serine/threonine protein kinase